MMKTNVRCAVLAAALLAAPLVHAADYGAPAPAAAPADPLASARGLISQSRWAEAIAELKRVERAQSADWNNLMGYSHRKAPAPDLAAAQRYYDAALRIDPKHRGALEYSGELRLMQGDVAGAKAKLASLAAACGRCAELDQLENAIASHEGRRPRTP